MTTETISCDQISAELKAIHKELASIRTEIKEHLPDKDMFLTDEEKKLLEESYINEKNGELVSLEELEQEIKR